MGSLLFELRSVIFRIRHGLRGKIEKSIGLWGWRFHWKPHGETTEE